jgi:transcriptional regulator with XRE-family HTH domain
MLPTPSAAGSITLSMAPDEQQFMKTLGARITKLRKEQGLSQQSVADKLGIAQQSYAHYEVGRVRMPLWMLPRLAQLFGVSADELIGEPTRSGKRGPASRLQQQIERLSNLPQAKQRLVIEMLEGVLMQAHR